MEEDEFRAVDTPSEDERLTPAYRRERHQRARTGHASFAPDGTRSEVREYVTAPGQENDACAAVEQALPDGWLVRWVFAEQGDSMVVRSITIEPEGRVTPSGGVTANTLRSVRPARVAAHLDALAIEAVRSAEQDPDATTPEALRMVVARGLARWRVPEQEPPARPSGQPPLPDDFLAEVALTHLEANGRNVYAAIAQKVARQRGMRPAHVPAQTVKSWVDAAEARGYLGPAKQGSRRRPPGPRLLAYLDRQNEQNGEADVDNDN